MSTRYEWVIGLEIHAELSTQSKIFCGCKNVFGAAPNTLSCPVCTGMPGSLPVLNRQVVDFAVKMGHALHCHINTVTRMDRKNYFYPDLPKAYQITQFDRPICENGYLECVIGDDIRRIGITRIHMEEDAGKLLHDPKKGDTKIDYNRCGVPLLEIVTEPDIRSADEAKAVMTGIAQILQYLEISDVKMQEGSMRADVNVSVRPMGQAQLATRCEMKNVNSFTAVHRAIAYEATRQMAVLRDGGTIEQQTRRWNDATGQSTVMRTKEDAWDYRFFPEPDLPAIAIDGVRVRQLKERQPELPLEKMHRYQEEFELSAYEAGLLCAQKSRAAFFEAAVALHPCAPKTIANWLLGDVARLLKAEKRELADTFLTPRHLVEMLQMIEAGELSNTAAKQVLALIIGTGVLPRQAALELGLLQLSHTAALSEMVASVLHRSKKAVDDYNHGKTGVLGYLVGQCMKESGGRANPEILRDLIEKAIVQK